MIIFEHINYRFTLITNCLKQTFSILVDLKLYMKKLFSNLLLFFSLIIETNKKKQPKKKQSAFMESKLKKTNCNKVKKVLITS